MKVLRRLSKCCLLQYLLEQSRDEVKGNTRALLLCPLGATQHRNEHRSDGHTVWGGLIDLMTPYLWLQLKPLSPIS